MRESSPGRYGTLSVERIRNGLPVEDLDTLARTLKVDRSQLARVLGISLRTLQRKAGSAGRLAPVASDRLARVRRILELATHVLGAEDKAARWLTSRSRALGDDIPLEALDTDLGTQRVQQELHQIEFGMPL